MTMPHDRKTPRIAPLLINASLGLGKTAATLSAIANIKEEVTVALLVPSLKKAAEAEAEYNKLRKPFSMPVQVFRGRGADNPSAPEEEKMCQRHKAAESVAKAGLGVETTLCATCQHRSACAYQRQIEALRNRQGRLIICMHDHLFLNAIPTSVDLLIIDESVSMKANITHRFAPNHIINCLPGQDMADNGGRIEKTLREIYNVFAADEHRQYLARMRAVCTKREIVAARRFLENTVTGRESLINGGMADAQIIENLKGVQSEAGMVIALLRQIELEWKSGRRDFNSLEIRYASGSTSGEKSGGQRQIFVHALKKPLLARRAPILLLDGTASIALNKKLFGDDLEYREFRVERNAYVMQTTGKGFSRQSITGKKQDSSPLSASSIADAERLQARIATYVNNLPHKSLLVLANKTVEAVLQPLFSDHIATTHFNAVRGINTYQNREAAACVGREQPSWSAVESIARAYAATDEEPFLSIADVPSDPNSGYFKVTRGIRRHDGKVSPVAVSVHPHPIVEEVMEQIREAEIVQAVDRIRPIHNRRSIYILNEVALDITVHSVVPWKRITGGVGRFVQAAMRGGAVPYSAAEMSRIYPDLWPNKKLAEHDMQRTPKSQIELLFEIWGFIEVQYKLMNQRGKYYTAWAKKDNPRKALESVVNKIKIFRGKL